MLDEIVMWLLTPVLLVLLFLFGPYYLIGVFIWWVIRTAINCAVPQGHDDGLPHRDRDGVRALHRGDAGGPRLWRRLQEAPVRVHQKTYERIHAKEARILDGRAVSAALTMRPTADPRRTWSACVSRTDRRVVQLDDAPAGSVAWWHFSQRIVIRTAPRSPPPPPPPPQVSACFERGDPENVAIALQQRASGVSRVDRGVGLGVGGVELRDHAGAWSRRWSHALADRAPTAIRATLIAPERHRLAVGTVAAERLAPPVIPSTPRLTRRQSGQLATRSAIQAAGRSRRRRLPPLSDGPGLPVGRARGG